MGGPWTDSFGAKDAVAYPVSGGPAAPPPGVTSTHVGRYRSLQPGGGGYDSAKSYHHIVKPGATGFTADTYPPSAPRSIASGEYFAWYYLAPSFTLTNTGFQNIFQWKIGYESSEGSVTMSHNYAIVSLMSRDFVDDWFGIQPPNAPPEAIRIWPSRARTTFTLIWSALLYSRLRGASGSAFALASTKAIALSSST